MATSKRTVKRAPPTKRTAPKAGRKPTKPAAGSVIAVEPTDFVDEFSAAGGVPSAPRYSGFDRSSQSEGARELGWLEFDRELNALARTIGRRFKPDLVIGLAHGGLFVGEALAAAVQKPFHPLHLVRRSRDRVSHGPGGPQGEMPAGLRGKRVLIVDDIAASGDSLEFAVRMAQERGAKAVATAVLVARPGRFEPDFAVFTSDTFFVFPWDYQSLVDEARFAPRR